MEALSPGHMSSASLPPLRNLPQWSRVGTVQKSRYPRSFFQDNVKHLPLSPNAKTPKSEVPHQLSPLYEQRDVDPNLRVVTLEKNLKFLQEQHSETLGKLHQEIEQLKRANQDLHFKMIMNQRLTPQVGSSLCVSPTGPISDTAQMSSRDHSTGRKHSQKGNQRRAVQQEDRVKEQRMALKEPQKHNSARRKLSTEAANRRNNGSEASQQSSSVLPVLTLQPELDETQILVTSLTPLLIQIDPSGSPRAPTLQECAIIVQHLHNTNSLQSQELLRLKTSLKDLLYSNKWTPDAYLLAKAYLADLSQDRDVVQLPKVPLKEPPKKLPETVLPTADRVILPALKNTVGNRATERQRRLQAVQKNRCRKVLL
ncbi:coiled-coil domain-containing protein 74B-like [Chiloscyllium plagiosum]|uniref:coiled-coil domain-containing protein 74B-like n=1 Tax=Chiloscyllium plagiosum TaxID=36176 RepID=UPI001CB87524|nr:coiled-coil domain-containing protein 74B-like [Chiloscyllium plagiosum]